MQLFAEVSSLQATSQPVQASGLRFRHQALRDQDQGEWRRVWHRRCVLSRRLRRHQFRSAQLWPLWPTLPGQRHLRGGNVHLCPGRMSEQWRDLLPDECRTTRYLSLLGGDQPRHL
jgi:hypothetical protein